MPYDKYGNWYEVDPSDGMTQPPRTRSGATYGDAVSKSGGLFGAPIQPGMARHMMGAPRTDVPQASAPQQSWYDYGVRDAATGGGIQIPRIPTSALQYTPGYDQYQTGSDSPLRVDSNFGFSDPNVGSQYGMWGNLSSGNNNFRSFYDPANPDTFKAAIKSGDKQGTEVNFNREGDYWVPQQGTSQFNWNTNPTGTDYIPYLAPLAFGGMLAAGAAGLGGAAAGAAGAGSGAGAGAAGLAAGEGAMLGGGVAPLTYGGTGGMAGGLGTAGAAAASGAGGIGAGTGTGAGTAAGTGTGASSMGWGDIFSGIGQAGSAINNWLPLLGAIGGGLEGSQDTTVTNQTQLPPWLQSLGPQLTNAAVSAAQQPFQQYSGQRIQPFGQDQQSAFNMVRQRAQGSPVETAGQDAVTRGATGNANPLFGLDNPYLNQQVENVTGDISRQFNRNVVPQLDAMNTRANTGFGTSSAMDDQRQEAYRNLNETTGKAANDLRYKDYYNQTQLGEGMAGRQLQAAGLAPNLSGLDYRNAEALLNVGNQQQGLGQQNQDFNYNEFLRQLQYPDTQLNRLGFPFGFNQGQTSTQTTPGAGWLSGALGGLLGGVGAANMARPANPLGNASQQTQYPMGWPYI